MQLFTNLHETSAGNSEAGQVFMPIAACGCPLCSGAGGNLQTAAGAGGALPGAPLSSTTTGSAGDAAALASGSQWGTRDASGKTVITYSFAGGWSAFSGDEAQFSATAAEFSAQDKATTRALLASISAVANVAFVEVADNGPDASQVRYAYSQAPNDMGFAGYAFFPSAGALGGDVWIGKNQASAQWDFYRPDLILHETLHAIGLKHPFEGGVTLDTQTNIIPNTVMSYSPVAGTSNGSLAQYPVEPMPLDVQELQNLYGAAAHNGGDTVYNLADPFFRSNFHALWDSGGNDTLDASAVGNAVALDLHAGARSDIGVRIGSYALFNGAASYGTYTSTLAITNTAQVENAVGSAFNDTLLGNDIDNLLQGGGGADVLDGRGGNDRLLGGAGDDRLFAGSGTDVLDGGTGTDTAVFSGSSSDYAVTESGGQLLVTRLAWPTDVTVLTGVERMEFSNAVMGAFTGAAPQTLSEVHVAEAFRLYQAAFDRLPDSDGLGYHARSLENGVPLWEVARQFVASPEFSSRYGQPQDAAFLTLLYQNVLDRAPDADGMAYYGGRLEQGAMTRADVLVGFSESPENQAHIVGLVGQGQLPMLYPV